MDKKIRDILPLVPLFEGADEENLFNAVSEGAVVRTFSTGEAIESNVENATNLVIILQGKARVFSMDESREVLLRTLEKGDVFGVAELFCGGDESISRVEAKGRCEALFIPEAIIGHLLENDKVIMYNYLNFLCQRIRFLNQRIACFTAGSAERRLALYLNSLANKSSKEDGEAKVTPDISMGALALMLDIGRASLYRAVETLIADGFIKKEEKSFILINRDKMLLKYVK